MQRLQNARMKVILFPQQPQKQGLLHWRDRDDKFGIILICTEIEVPMSLKLMKPVIYKKPRI